MQLLALHGQMGMASDWDSLAESMTKIGHQLETVDLWSYLEGGEATLKEFGTKLNGQHEKGKVLLGYSMGGRLALHALIDDPEKWKAAVIISAHTGLILEERGCRRKADDKWASLVVNSPWGGFLREWNKQEVLGKDVMPDRSVLEIRKNEITRSFRCWSLAEQDNLLDELGGIEIPVLWIVGGNDEKFCNYAEQAVKFLKNVRLVKVQNSGHRVPWEAESEVLDAIARFMGEVL